MKFLIVGTVCLFLLGSCREELVDKNDSRIEKLLIGQWSAVTDPDVTNTRIFLSFNTNFIGRIQQITDSATYDESLRYFVEEKNLYFYGLHVDTIEAQAYILEIDETQMLLITQNGQQLYSREL